MTIEKGAAWGRPMAVPAGARPVSGDGELAAAAADALAAGEHLIAVLTPPDVSGGDGGGRLVGDIARTIGVQRSRAPGDRLGFVLDLGFVRLDGGPAVAFVAHVVGHRRLWTGEFVVVMNAAWMGDWYLGPRAHPNDGVLDVTVGSLPFGQRLGARRRVRTGTHVPHPCLTTTRARTFTHRLGRPTPFTVDGRRIATARSVEAWIEPDCFTLIA